MLLRLLSRLRAWLAPKRKASKPAGSMLEPLESRISPATLLSPHIVTYTDTAGDHVTIKSSNAIFSSANVDSILSFNTGTVNGTNTPQELLKIDLTGFGLKSVAGDDISVTVKTASGGAGLANVGLIKSDFGLGHVLVQGNLGAIDAGVEGAEGSHYVGLASLVVNSLGSATVPAGGNLMSTIFGAVGSITVEQNVANAQLTVSSDSISFVGNGNIGSLKIGGSLVGSSNSLSGSITTDGNIGSILIGQDIQGGSGTNSASFQVGGKIGSLTVDGSIVGYTVAGDTSGSGQGSAAIVTGVTGSVAGIGSVTIMGNLQGGDGNDSGEISQTTNATGGIGSVKIGGALLGGSGTDKLGALSATAFGSISIGKGITGGSGVNSGSINSVNSIGSLKILGGGIVGGTAKGSGAVNGSNGTIGSVLVYGDITGNSTALSTIQGTGQINAGSINSFTLYGSLNGSAAIDTGSILVTESIGHVAIHGTGMSGSLLGGAGSNTGEISAVSIGSVSIDNQIQGGAGLDSGSILATGKLGSVTIGEGIFGGSGTGSGAISTGTGFGVNLGSLTITGGGITGGKGANSGQVGIGGTIGSVNLHGTAVTGGTGASSGSIVATDNIGSISLGSLLSVPKEGAGAGEISTGGNLNSLTFISSTPVAVSGEVEVSGAVGSISVHGDVAGGSADSTGLFLISGGVNNFSISGALRGGGGNSSGAIFAGLDDTSVIGSLTISGGIFGGGGPDSGEVFGGGGIGKSTIGDIIGGGGQASGSIVSDGALGAITVTGAATGVTTHGIIGGGGINSGQIFAGTTIASVTVKGALQGGSTAGSGSIVSSSLFTESGDIQGNIGSISITKGIVGGAGANSGQISAAGNIKSVSITGSVTGGQGNGSGAILAGVDLTGVSGGDITTLKISGALTGADVATGNTVNGSGYIEAGHIGALTVGSIHAGAAAAGSSVTDDGAILAANDIASLSVTGAITGNSSNPVVISADGQLNPGKHGDLAFGAISVGGSVTYTNFLAGYDQSGAPDPSAGAASIGSVKVGGNWSGSNLVAAVIAGSNGHFGDPGATLISSSKTAIPSIASIIIKGSVQRASPTDSADTYGFVAGKVEALSIDGHAVSLASLSALPIDPVGNSFDTVVRDV